MTHPEHNGQATHEGSEAAQANGHDETESQGPSEAVTVAATVGVVAAGAALFEVALLPGIALGVAAMLAPRYVPKMGSALTPMFRSSVRSVYRFGQKTREMVAEAKEQVNDIVAEVHAEEETAPKKATKARGKAATTTADAPSA
jgi:hypothetical protein